MLVSSVDYYTGVSVSASTFILKVCYTSFMFFSVMFPAATTIVSRTMFKLMPDPELAYIGNTVHQIIKNRKAEANANKVCVTIW